MEQKPNFWKDAIKPSLIISLISIILSVLVYVFDLITIGLFAGFLIGILSFIISIVIFVFLLKAYRNDKLNGFMTYGKALLFGIIIAVYASFILSAYNTIFNTVIDPEYEKNIAIKIQDKTEEFMINKGLPDEAIEDAIQKSQEKIKEIDEKSIMRKTMGVFLVNFIMLFIAVLIAAAFAKKEGDPFKTAMQEVEE
ncbi:MAG: hypothetical protein A2W99_13110 [Bacteroidetes bacterium GWF2_33_16]|nr:MAG: hypothetical protein A2X00_01165 [Bacteroidetes bacterium GWE2_32_14]OFY06618.1 MAG: hypothetical protein A2W99_13110 [Bacteroidetes bacterium GWF2_33_16]